MVQIALRIQPVGLGRLQQGKNRSAGVGAGLGVAEKPVFPADDNRSNRILHLVVADFNFAVVEERAKVLPLVQGVGNRLLQLARRFENGLQPGIVFIHNENDRSE